MANRVLMGNRATGGYGLYVSKTGDDVLTTTNPMAFDSRTGTGWAVKDYGQFIISAGGADVTKTHNLGYNPLVAIRWSTSITSGVSTLVFNPCASFDEREREVGGQANIRETSSGLSWSHVNTNSIIIKNQSGTIEDGVTTDTGDDLYIAYIIFFEPDFTGGRGI